MKRCKGFTMVEVMVSVSLAGTLCMLATVSFRGPDAEAHRRLCHAQQRTLNGALEAWRFDHPGEAPGFTNEFAERLVLEGYLRTRPLDPGHEREGVAPYVIAEGALACSHHGSPGGR